jgi:hypothetical protein
MATSFSSERSRSTQREPPTMSKQLVNFITCGCESAVVLSVFLDLHFLITPLVSSDDQAVYVVMNLHVSNEDMYVFILVYMVELFDFCVI